MQFRKKERRKIMNLLFREMAGIRKKSISFQLRFPLINDRSGITFSFLRSKISNIIFALGVGVIKMVLQLIGIVRLHR